MLKRTGGVAGLTRTITVDTTAEPSSLAAELRNLVAGARVEQPRPSTHMPEGAADMMTYRLSIHCGPTVHVQEFTEADMDGGLHALVARLETMNRDRS